MHKHLSSGYLQASENIPFLCLCAHYILVDKSIFKAHNYCLVSLQTFISEKKENVSQSQKNLQPSPAGDCQLPLETWERQAWKIEMPRVAKMAQAREGGKLNIAKLNFKEKILPFHSLCNKSHKNC